MLEERKSIHVEAESNFNHKDTQDSYACVMEDLKLRRKKKRNQNIQTPFIKNMQLL